jgi:hypothetical protein
MDALPLAFNPSYFEKTDKLELNSLLCAAQGPKYIGEIFPACLKRAPKATRKIAWRVPMLAIGLFAGTATAFTAAPILMFEKCLLNNYSLIQCYIMLKISKNLSTKIKE